MLATKKEKLQMGDITLHPEKGVNPHLGQCPGCGKDSGVVLLGRMDYVDICEDCGMAHYGGAKDHACAKCRSGRIKRRQIEDHERIPLVCEECEKESADFMLLVKEHSKSGAIGFSCKECRKYGIFNGESELARAVRRSRPAPDPVVLMFKTCAEHGEPIPLVPAPQRRKESDG